MSDVLIVRDLTKHFGKIKAVQNLSFELKRGTVFGMLGPNGSGKTTTLAMLLGVVRKTSGHFDWFGKGEHYALRKKIGAILEQPIFYPNLSALQNLRITAKIKEIQAVPYEQLLDTVGLLGRHNDAFKTYSLGMKQRLAIASAMLCDPEVLIFDEPTNGLDPQGIADIRSIISQIADQGKTIILASHLLDEVQKVCTDFMVLQSGTKIYQASVQEILHKNEKIELAAANMSSLKDLIEGRNDLILTQQQAQWFVVEPKEKNLSLEELNRYFFERGITLVHLRKVFSSLEQEFLEILSTNN